ncbi:tRNA 1-methyladenosine methyltransferase subunit GCD10 NDAI_0D01040 [Naumovozyma dairenensis CBS 421]|uniref:tRNA (adenine(58)-N(1))-methyltransferase non-catalytic subunit TRM6 n=1 Tax=Naumovozyma dairenensis (strain ATCC 10597 / BCRC 20456 / CBS 421 / NBRC 0211 / NRRL Y-12639) TaxID=1071378 RepID=G0W9F6_NAUDC|nr:hypothetical protein NDAI_0D01040 [Naumovozyma dairenensis CBS 421]CCD24417.1 hypothetical protein NDAI_0D01040 [Naumovozyma dairenensis CBS 421]
MDPLKTICAEQHVIIKLPSDNNKLVQLKPDTSISLGKFGAFNVNDIIGYPLGTKFEILYDGDEKEEQVPATGKFKYKIPTGKIKVLDDDVEKTEGERLENVVNSENNQHLVNLGNEVQKLSAEEIEALKEKSVSSSEIISKMIESHGSFDKKTVYSQEKYLKRKKQKFDKIFTVDYLSSSALLQFLIDKGDIQRIMDMSQESVAMLLNLANIKENGNYLCMDETGGLLVYFLLERMFGGDDKSKSPGKIIVVHENEHPNLDLLKFSNYSESFINEHVITISLLEFFEPPTIEDINKGFTPLSKDELYQLKSGQKNKYYRRLKWYHTKMDILKFSTEIEFDALIIASTLHLPSLVPILGEKVHGSRPIVCYSQFKETLLELAHVLYEDLRYLAPSVLETRCRPYQTIRGRLHPLMTMKGGGGYLLWCHRVIPASEPLTIQNPDVSKAIEQDIKVGEGQD